MSKSDLLTELGTRTLLCDGAMGTQLIARGLAAGECGEQWNLTRPDDIEAIHRAYAHAGCDLITTNTFGGTTCSLERHGLGDQADELNRAGAALARKAVGEERPHWVLGDIGPFGGFLEPIGEMSPRELRRIFEQQALALRRGGADAIIIETMVDPAEMALAIKAAQSVADWPVIATYAFNKTDGPAPDSSPKSPSASPAGTAPEFRTIMGTSVADAVGQAVDAGADVVGANCGTSLGLGDYLHLARALVQAAGRVPVILQPNAGSPQMVEGKLIHPASPAQMAELVPQLKALGVRIIGGCCGTTPAHLAAMAAALK